MHVKTTGATAKFINNLNAILSMIANNLIHKN